MTRSSFREESMRIPPSVNSGSIRSDTSNEPEPFFKPLSCPSEEYSITVQPNEVHLIPLLGHSCQHKFELTAHQSTDRASPTSKRLIDDLILLTSSAGVIFGRIPNSLSNSGVTNWLNAFIDYISSSEQAAWWHSDFSGPWACYVFVPMNKTRTTWLYPSTRDARLRPLKILSILDRYAEEKPWLLQLPGWEQAESWVAEIRGKCYVPTPNISRQQKQSPCSEQQDGQRPAELKTTEIKFVWDPVQQIREVRLKDAEWENELVLERVEMSLI